MEQIFYQSYQKFFIYKTDRQILIYAISPQPNYCKIITISRTSPQLKTTLLEKSFSFKKGLVYLAKLIISSSQQDPFIKSHQQDYSFILSKHFLCECQGIIGCPQFVDGHYLYLILKKKFVGYLFKAKVYQVEECRLEMILTQELSALYKAGKVRNTETKYLGIFNSVEVTDFYFSYDVDLTRSVSEIANAMIHSQHFFKEKKVQEQQQQLLKASDIGQGKEEEGRDRKKNQKSKKSRSYDKIQKEQQDSKDQYEDDEQQQDQQRGKIDKEFKSSAGYEEQRRIYENQKQELIEMSKLAKESDDQLQIQNHNSQELTDPLLDKKKSTKKSKSKKHSKSHKDKEKSHKTEKNDKNEKSSSNHLPSQDQSEPKRQSVLAIKIQQAAKNNLIHSQAQLFKVLPSDPSKIPLPSQLKAQSSISKPKNSLNTFMNNKLNKSAHIPVRNQPTRLFQISSKFCYNTHILQPLITQIPFQELFTPVICGTFKTKTLTINFRKITVGVISRRSRFHGGPRFLRRGINFQGHVANEVETELFTFEHTSYQDTLKQFTVYKFLRGSVPFFWGHEKVGYSPKPDIVVHKDIDPQNLATDKHFERVKEQYGSPIICFNLVKKTSKKESKLGQLFDEYYDKIKRRSMFIQGTQSYQGSWFMDFNSFQQQEADSCQGCSPNIKEKISDFREKANKEEQEYDIPSSSYNQSLHGFLPSFVYEWYDFFSSYHENEELTLKIMQQYGNHYLSLTNFDHYDFSSSIQITKASQDPSQLINKSYIKSTQRGIIRVNCVDCLDRTNNAMACISSVVFAKQLLSMGIKLDSFNYDSEAKAVKGPLLQVILQIFGFNGDKIAQQYAGSNAFHKAQIYQSNQGEWKTLKQNIALIAMRRYISNVLTDHEKQRTLWLFLGVYQPNKYVKQQLWDIDAEDPKVIQKLAAIQQVTKVFPHQQVMDSNELPLMEMRNCSYPQKMDAEQFVPMILEEDEVEYAQVQEALDWIEIVNNVDSIKANQDDDDGERSDITFKHSDKFLDDMRKKLELNTGMKEDFRKQFMDLESDIWN